MQIPEYRLLGAHNQGPGGDASYTYATLVSVTDRKKRDTEEKRD